MDQSLQQAYLNSINNKQDRLSQIELKLKNQPYSIDTVIDLLIISYIDEQLAELNYLYSYNFSQTDGKNDCDVEFKQHQQQQRDHKYLFLNRLRQLGVIDQLKQYSINDWLNKNSSGIQWKQETENTTHQILLNRLNQEKNAIKFYQLCVEYTRGTEDSTTYTLFKKVKQDEQKHLLDLSDLAREYKLISTVDNPVLK